jgi:hypothetical protein
VHAPKSSKEAKREKKGEAYGMQKVPGTYGPTVVF